MSQRDCNFFIAKENFEATLKAIQNLHGKETIQDGWNHFSWVAHDFYEIDNLTEILKEWRWSPKFDNEGNIVKINFTGEKLGDDNILFEAINPYVRTDSSISMIGEDHHCWSWHFSGEGYKEIQEKISQ